jgi:hypothetical protein
LREQLDALTHAERQAAELQRQQAIAAEVTQRCQNWAATNELAQRNLASLDPIHRDAVDAGHVTGSPSYFDFMNNQLEHLDSRQHHRAVEEMRSSVAQDRQPERPQPVPRPIVSAPVSRDPGYGSSPTSIRLTKEQSEFAKMAGITEKEYAAELSSSQQAEGRGPLRRKTVDHHA